MNAHRKPAETDLEVLPAIKARYSSRCYDPDRPVEHGKIALLLEAARWAPSSYNEQPWRFVLCLKGTDAWSRASESLLERNRVWAGRAPLLVVCAAKERYSHVDRENIKAEHDLGMATVSLQIQAAALGLVSCEIAGIDRAKAEALFRIPEGFSLFSILAVGYPGEPEALPPDVRERELRPRSRRPVEEVAFDGEWGNGWRG